MKTALFILHQKTSEAGDIANKLKIRGFDFVTIASDLRALSAGAKAVVEKMKGSSKKEESKAY